MESPIFLCAAAMARLASSSSEVRSRTLLYFGGWAAIGIAMAITLGARTRLDLSVGPIAITIDVPLETVTLDIAANDGSLAGKLRFAGRHFPIEEPRFTRRNGTRLFMDYTRMTQNGHWSGWLAVNGARVDVGSDWAGTRDRSWGIRPVGAAEPQPPPQALVRAHSTAEAPGAASTGKPSAIAARASWNPGSATSGVPASEA